MNAIRCVIGGALLLLGTGCSGADLPEDFEQLSLQRQVEAYEQFFADGGLSSSEADALISSQGFPAAEAMVPFIVGEREGIPRYVAVNIVWKVQLRGCSLRGTPAEHALRSLLKEPVAEPLYSTAQAAVEAIEDNRQVPTLLDRYGAGACAGPQEKPGMVD